MLLLPIIFLSIGLLVHVWLILLLQTNFKKHNWIHEQQPTISILLAVRNEQDNLKRCLDSLVNLDYPKERIQILIGNDFSEDNTAEIIKNYTQNYPYITSVEIQVNVGHQEGKANVLMQLAQEASGDFYFFTDADMEMPSQWISSMLAAMKPGVGLAIGATGVANSAMQDMDWLFALGMVKVVTDLKHPVTGVGNNMVVSAEAYNRVGGYEKLPFSITEDFELFNAIHKEGYKCEHVFSDTSLGKTLAAEGVYSLLNQRKRWMIGATKLPWYMVLLLAIQVGFYVALVALLLLNLKVGLIMLGFKLILQFLFLGSIRKRLGIPINGIRIIGYEIYAGLISLLVVVYYFLPVKVKWKGRTYLL